MLSTKMTASVTIEAGSWIRVVNTNVTKTAPAATMARMRTRRLAPVSARIRTWAAVIMVKITRATALPIEAIESSLNTTASTRHAPAWISSPFAARPRGNTRPGQGPPAEFGAHQRGELPGLGQPLGYPLGRVHPGIGGPGGGE